MSETPCPKRKNVQRRITIINRQALYEQSIQPRNLLPLLLEVASERLFHPIGEEEDLYNEIMDKLDRIEQLNKDRY